MSGELRSTSRGQTLVLTLYNPEHRNALGPEIYAAGIEALNAADANPEIRSVIITGEGANFCAGGNLRRLQANRAQPPQVQQQSVDALHSWIETVRAFPKPVIAAVEGACAGAGFSLALACDMIVSARDAVFVMAYVNVALSPDGGASWQLTRALPRQTVAQLLMAGERITPQRLLELGVVNELAEHGGALDTALERAQRLNAMAPNALAAIKELMNEAPLSSLNQQLARECELFVRNLHHANGGEGIGAFLDKRKPQYR